MVWVSSEHPHRAGKPAVLVLPRSQTNIYQTLSLQDEMATLRYFSSHPPVYEKDTKILVWNCALHSASGVAFDFCAHAHIGSGGEEVGTASMESPPETNLKGFSIAFGTTEFLGALAVVMMTVWVVPEKNYMKALKTVEERSYVPYESVLSHGAR
uniref:Uncharacterized protein n=1 Tax=Timema poppense TaxID=170557 RepID=A0A7R9HA18_TIMPO|nr:unnamed protein product [Timema poppensis]